MFKIIWAPKSISSSTSLRPQSYLIHALSETFAFHIWIQDVQQVYLQLADACKKSNQVLHCSSLYSALSMLVTTHMTFLTHLKSGLTITPLTGELAILTNDNKRSPHGLFKSNIKGILGAGDTSFELLSRYTKQRLASPSCICNSFQFIGTQVKSICQGFLIR